MDYCHPCRRHLNGALACPGCGAPASRPDTYEQQPLARERHVEAEGAADPGGSKGSGDVEGADGSGDPDGSGEGPRGRPVRRRDARRASGPAGAGAEASRRDRKAAAHRRRRRRTVLITAGFVLAAGGLSLAELGIDAPGFSSPNPAVAGGESAEVEDSTPEPSATAQPPDDREDAATSSPSPDASASPSESESPKEEGEESEYPAPGPRSASVPAATPAPSTPADPAVTPPADPPPSSQPPKPSPSESCNRFLWWCT
ncbi:SCO2400 family protein [Streptomyces antibioticus]|uniref:SCO2400 family protein n=1 Tax=Streptomyces antibioticus TaxID=1890 RepID=UPI003F4D2933